MPSKPSRRGTEARKPAARKPISEPPSRPARPTVRRRVTLASSQSLTIKMPRTVAYRVWVDVSDPKCLAEWLECFDCSEARLRRAVAEVGMNSLKVRRWLERAIVDARWA